MISLFLEVFYCSSKALVKVHWWLVAKILFCSLAAVVVMCGGQGYPHGGKGRL